MRSNNKTSQSNAIKDLMTELQKDSIKLDDESEHKVVEAVKNSMITSEYNDVQILAANSLAFLVNKVKENQVKSIFVALSANLVSSIEQWRNSSFLALKKVIKECSQTPTLGENTWRQVTENLIAAIEKKDVSVHSKALDILSDLLSCFRELLIPFHDKIRRALLPRLSSERPVVKKHTVSALSQLLTCCNERVYAKVTKHLLNTLEKRPNRTIMITNFHCLVAIW